MHDKLIATIVITSSISISAWSAPAETGTTHGRLESSSERFNVGQMHLNPVLGASQFEHSKGSEVGDKSARLSGGLLVEMGESPARRLETGLMILNTDTGSISSSYLSIPMMAKLRIFNMGAQSWFAKVGALAALETSSSRDEDTRNLDVLAAIGAGGRLRMTRAMDLLIDATYNRGLIDNLKSNGNNYNQGILLLGGISFRL